MVNFVFSAYCGSYIDESLLCQLACVQDDSGNVSSSRATCRLVIVEIQVCHVLEIFMQWPQQQSECCVVSSICWQSDMEFL